MAPKRSRHYDDPPSPESSEEILPPKQPQPEEEDEEEEEEEEEEYEEVEEEVEEEEEEEVEEEDEEEEVHAPTPISKLPPQQQLESDSDDETEESDDDDVDDTTTPATSAPTPSPSVNKPSKEEPLKVSKQSQDDTVEEKKPPINRVWSFTDEIAVLQGMIDYKIRNNKDPGANSDDFYSFVKDNLGNGNFSKTQLMDKVRRLKKKYRNNLSKSSVPGKDPEISNPHELKSFQLSKRIWGDLNANGNSNSNSSMKVTVAVLSDETVVNGVVSNGDLNASGSRTAKKVKISDKMEVDEEDNGNGAMVEVEDEDKEFKRLYPFLMKSFVVGSVNKVPMLDTLKSFLSLIDSAELEEWNREWKEIYAAETEVYIRRLALVQEQSRLIFDAMKSPKR